LSDVTVPSCVRIALMCLFNDRQFDTKNNRWVICQSLTELTFIFIYPITL
jgi:hypothetical protein